MLAAGRPIMPRSVGAVAAAPWHSSHTESKSSAPALTSPIMATSASREGDWARAFHARIALAATEIAASRKAEWCGFLTVNIRFAPVIVKPSRRDQVYAQNDERSNYP